MLEKLDSTPNKPSFRLMNHDDNKFLSKILSRETALSQSTEPSFRVYYGSRSGSVPFYWESEPGTPKHALHEINAPPLTPPPAYNYLNSSDHSPTKKKLHSRSNLLRILFLKARPKSGCSRSMLMKSSPDSKSTGTGRPRIQQSFDSFEDSSCSSSDSKEDDQDNVKSSPTLTLCFGGRRLSSRSRSWGLGAVISSIYIYIYTG